MNQLLSFCIFGVLTFSFSSHATRIIALASRGGGSPRLVQDSMIAMVYHEPETIFELKPKDEANALLRAQLSHIKVGRYYVIEAVLDPITIDPNSKAAYIPAWVESIRALDTSSNCSSIVQLGRTPAS